MKEIKLTRGMSAIVDDEVFAEVSQYKWCARPGRKTYYAERSDWNGSVHHTVSMHALIARPSPGMTVHHINEDGLDNRLENLRVVTSGEHLALHPRSWNTELIRLNNQGRKYWGKSSKYVGVCRRKNAVRWEVRIKVRGKSIYLGSFETERQAAIAYNEAAIHYYGSSAHLNAI